MTIADAATLALTTSAEAIRLAKEWIKDCVSEDSWEDVDDAAAPRIIRWVARTYDGGWNSFLADALLAQ